MDWVVLTLILGLTPLAAILLGPLILYPKSSLSYIKLWSAYGIVTSGVILSFVWLMMNTPHPPNPQAGFPMSPIGNATVGRLIHAAGFLTAIPMALYVFTIGLPWVFRSQKPQSVEDDGIPPPASRPESK